MGRPKHLNPVEFVAGEVTAGTGFDRRTLQFVRDRRAGPFGSELVMEMAANGFYGENALCELAMAAGVHGAGFPLLQALAIVRAFLEENSKHAPPVFSNLGALEDPRQRRETLSWFHSACKTRAARGGRESGDPERGDLVLVIADRKYVLEARHDPRLRTLAPPGIDDRLPIPLARIVSLEGNQAEVVAFPFEFEAGPDHDFRNAYEVYHKAYLRAVAVTRVNISLAVRNAFDRIQDMRIEKGGPCFPVGGERECR